MSQIALIFPHQLFKQSPLIDLDVPLCVVEEHLFFTQYKFHKQKLVLHRASMKQYVAFLKSLGKKVTYIEAIEKNHDIRTLIPSLINKGITVFHLIDPVDNWLEKRIRNTTKHISTIYYSSPLFINTKSQLQSFFKPSKKKFFQTSFYKQQRRSKNVLMNLGLPEGGRWTYDTDNRKKYPKNKTPPPIHHPDLTQAYTEAVDYVNKNFRDNYGHITDYPLYPHDHESTDNWFETFLESRFHDFGAYEDAIVKDAHILNHSVLSPLINIGLICPKYVINRSIQYSRKNNIPINSTEGFIRQILGWREFIRGVYLVKGSEERTKNFWHFTRRIPPSFYNGTTGIVPVDNTIKKVLKTGYAHHIERLMILGNFMVLCEFDPNEVYKWFMELFIDAYDWVMVPNVYGMSLYADGGIMSTKPYISSSNYIMKMSNYKKGPWQKVWDGLFWSFMNKHRSFFVTNPRLKMLISLFDKMPKEKQLEHFHNAKTFINSLL